MIRNIFLALFGLPTNGIPSTSTASAATLGMLADMECDTIAAAPAPLYWAA